MVYHPMPMRDGNFRYPFIGTVLAYMLCGSAIVVVPDFWLAEIAIVAAFGALGLIAPWYAYGIGWYGASTPSVYESVGKPEL